MSVRRRDPAAFSGDKHSKLSACARIVVDRTRNWGGMRSNVLRNSDMFKRPFSRSLATVLYQSNVGVELSDLWMKIKYSGWQWTSLDR